MRRCAPGEGGAGSRSHEQRPDEVRAAALVLLRCALAVLVRPDRDVLGAVVRGELSLAKREQRRREGKRSRGELLYRRRKACLAGWRVRRRRQRRARRAPWAAGTRSEPGEGCGEPGAARAAPRAAAPARAARAGSPAAAASGRWRRESRCRPFALRTPRMWARARARRSRAPSLPGGSSPRPWPGRLATRRRPPARRGGGTRRRARDRTP